MKITVWIRADKSGRRITLRTDAKYESLDTPMVQNFGRKLMDAIESWGLPSGNGGGKPESAG